MLICKNTLFVRNHERNTKRISSNLVNKNLSSLLYNQTAKYKMKRTISIFLLFIMMLIAIHPVIAMHFCGGELHSFNLYQTSHNHICCTPQIVITTNESSCCSKADDIIPEYSINSNIDLFQSSCCDYETVEISTDNFHHKVDERITLVPQLLTVNNWIVLKNLFTVNPPPEDANNFIKDFPPKGLFMEDVSILTYICIYRI